VWSTLVRCSMSQASPTAHHPPRTRSRREGEKMKKFNRRRQKAQAQEGLQFAQFSSSGSQFLLLRLKQTRTREEIKCIQYPYQKPALLVRSYFAVASCHGRTKEYLGRTQRSPACCRGCLFKPYV
jgi:hypothetical protein